MDIVRTFSIPAINARGSIVITVIRGHDRTKYKFSHDPGLITDTAIRKFHMQNRRK